MATPKSTASRKSPARARPKRVVVPAAAEPANQSRIVPEATACIFVQLEPGLEIKDAETAHQLLSAALRGGGAVTVDVGRLRAVDTAGVQLLLAFQGEASRRGVTIEFRGESAPLTHTLAVLGLVDKISCAAARG